MNEFEALFRATETATRLAFVVTLCSLYDPSRRAVTIERYAKHIWQGKAPLEWTEGFDEAAATARRLYNLRNNYFAHSSEVTFERDLFREANLNYRALSSLMSETWRLVTDLISDDGGNLVYSNTLSSTLRDLFPMIELPLAWGGVNEQTSESPN